MRDHHGLLRGRTGQLLLSVVTSTAKGRGSSMNRRAADFGFMRVTRVVLVVVVTLVFIGIGLAPRAEAGLPCAQEVERECEVVRQTLCKFPPLCLM